MVRVEVRVRVVVEVKVKVRVVVRVRVVVKVRVEVRVVVKMKIKANLYKCLRCFHIGIGQLDHTPKECPACKNRNWDKPSAPN